MTQVTLYWGKEALVGLESQGHSDCGDEGEDVVCAAVSALVHALLLGLNDVAKLQELRCEWSPDPETPVIRVAWGEESAGALDLLTRTIALSLKEIASGHPGHVSIVEVRL